jgi:UDP-glucose:(heptosyl)LPS alpha-1,3-glucosyltransferase
MAEMLAAKGHRVRILTRIWDGELPNLGVEVVELGQRGWTNLRRDVHFERDVARWLAEREGVDCKVGFIRLSLEMDFLYAADPCYVAKMNRQKSSWHRLTPRYRYKANAEHSIFIRGGKGKILLLTDMEVPVYKDLYDTEEERLLVLAPSIRHRALSISEKSMLRQKQRQKMGWRDNETVVLFVGSGFATKGLDRAIRAIADLGRGQCRFVIVGSGKAKKYQDLSQSLGFEQEVEFLGARDDAWELMVASDLLLHPARSENTGTVLVEALSAGTGVLTTDCCGFASHVETSGAGFVCASPFSHKKLVEALREQLLGDWEIRAEQALSYSCEKDLYSGLISAVSYIESFTSQR